TRDSRKIEAVVLEISDSEVKYKKQSNPDGPTYVEKKSNIATIVYSNGDVEVFPDAAVQEVVETTSAATGQPVYAFMGWSGNQLPKFVYEKVHVPGKKYKKYRYVAVDGSMVLTDGEFEDYIKTYCPEAYKYHRRAVTFLVLECVSILLGLIPVIIFACCGISASHNILPTYNNSCATQPLSLNPMEEDSDDGAEVALAIP
ncbi:MAG: hypothetical protein J6Y77_03085, partial [Paludibacteraceae bacterium]|nr:hypothetical protein [Paludibacteraceae bacterium]